MIPEQAQHIHREHTWAERVIWWSVHSFGAVTILACIATGAIVILVIVFRKVLKERIGDFLELADNYINGKK